ncbi:hypothetical protein [Candidatus Vondammii sp. HM_W22]|nr:hypothetical protein [Candidatus Vondammii sp. HM_W22]
MGGFQIEAEELQIGEADQHAGQCQGEWIKQESVVLTKIVA